MQTRVAVLGASGYAGVELTKILDGHPSAELTVASSDRWVGDTLAARTGVRSELRYSPLDAAVAYPGKDVKDPQRFSPRPPVTGFTAW